MKIPNPFAYLAYPGSSLLRLRTTVDPLDSVVFFQLLNGVSTSRLLRCFTATVLTDDCFGQIIPNERSIDERMGPGGRKALVPLIDAERAVKKARPAAFMPALDRIM